MTSQSKKKYTVAYENFLFWAGDKYKNVVPSERVLTKYFFYLRNSKLYKSSTIHSIFSMINKVTRFLI